MNFAPLSVIQTFSVPIIPDSILDPNETVVLSLTKATSATVNDIYNSAMLRIIDDDCVDDGYEPDDVPGDADNHAIGTQQVHNFCTDTVDWVYFMAGTFDTYTITTSSDGAETHPALAVFDNDGQTMLTSTTVYTGNKNTLVWRSPVGGKYYVRATNELPSGIYYSLSITMLPAPTNYLPIVMRDF